MNKTYRNAVDLFGTGRAWWTEPAVGRRTTEANHAPA